MSTRIRGYEVRRFDRNRQLVLDAGWIARRRNMIHGLVEVDVTRPRRLLRQYKAETGHSLSFTAFVLPCLGRAVAEDRAVHAYRNWRNQLLLFDSVDVTITIEKTIAGRKFPLVHIIRGAERRQVLELHREIRAVQADSGQSPGWDFIRYFPLLPTPLRRMIYRVIARSPQLQQRYIGTVGLTSVGMFGSRPGWGIGLPGHTLAVILGGITAKPGIVDGQIAIREYLNLTVSFDHDMVDGAPASRFTQSFTNVLEQGYGLEALAQADA